jgi:hypothetical protein
MARGLVMDVPGQALVSLLFFDPPRSDFYEYLLHHLVTIFLIWTSFCELCLRSCDMSDVTHNSP